MLVFRMFCIITQSSDAHRTESVSVTDHRQWEWIKECWTRNGKTSLAVSHWSGAWNARSPRAAELTRNESNQESHSNRRPISIL